MCPNNPIGTVDLYFVSHHGTDAVGLRRARSRRCSRASR